MARSEVSPQAAELIDDLLRAIPELDSIYQDNVAQAGSDVGAHVTYGDVLVESFLVPLLRAPREDAGTLARIFGFLESVASSKGDYAREVVKVTVCERLGNDKRELMRARKYMGPVTLALSSEVEKFWGRE